MNKSLPKYPRILAIAPSTKGFGYAVFEGHKMLVHSGVKSVKGDKNAGAIVKADDMIARYNPQVMVLAETATKESHRAPRIQALTRRLVAVAGKRAIKVVVFSQRQ